jgi:NADH-quinone oxidoreductase subunit E
MRTETTVEYDGAIDIGEKRTQDMTGASDDERVVSIIMKNNCDKVNLLSILLDIQTEFNYLPKSALKLVSNRLNIPMSRVYGVATFYRAYSLKPRGRHIITVCLGTACHVRGGGRIADTITRHLKIGPGETTKDMEFSLEAVNCLGACALGPIVVIDNKYHGNVTPSGMEKLLKSASS